MNYKVIIPILIYILLVIITITIVIVLFYYKPFDKYLKIRNTYSKIQPNIDKLQIKEQVSELKDTTDDLKKTKKIHLDDKKITYDLKEDKSQKTTIEKKQIKDVFNKMPLAEKEFTQTKERYSKGSSLPDQKFDSYGEYISEEDYNYRITLIKNLIIKTVIIDKLTKGNGISQEFFKVVYLDKMIPAKILEEIVESKEFRNLIPSKYTKEEIKIKGLGKKERVVFNNQNIKNLLILWSQGRLTPVQKAWKVKAEK